MRKLSEKGAAWSGAICGIDSGVLATAVSLLSGETGLRDGVISSFVGIGFLGTLFATLFAGRLADRSGRKAAVVTGAVAYVLGAAVLVAGTDGLPLLFSGRFLTGVGLGLLYVAVPLYLAETASADRRGRTVGLFQLLMTVGIFVGALIAVVLETSRQCFAVPGMICLLCLPAIMLLPSSRAGGTRSSQGPRRGELFRNRSFWLVLAVGALVPLSGIGPVLDYSVTVFRRAGLCRFDANGVDVMIKGVNLAMTLPALYLIDRVGRRSLMIGGSAVMAAALAMSAGAFAFPGTAGALVAALGCLAYIAAFAIGPGVCMWLVIPESLPRAMRAHGMAAALLVDYAAVTALVTGFLPFASRFGLPAGFALLATFSLLLAAVSVAGLRETKGRAL